MAKATPAAPVAIRSHYLCGSFMWPETQPSSACSGAPSSPLASCARRGGAAFDPAIAARLADEAEKILSLDDHTSAWEETLASEPTPELTLEGEAIDRALAAMGDLADLASSYLVGHSRGVPTALTGGVSFALGALGFARGIARSVVLSPGLTRLVVGALVVMAAARFAPVGAGQYVIALGGVVALWPVAYEMWRHPEAQPAGQALLPEQPRNPAEPRSQHRDW